MSVGQERMYVKSGGVQQPVRRLYISSVNAHRDSNQLLNLAEILTCVAPE